MNEKVERKIVTCQRPAWEENVNHKPQHNATQLLYLYGITSLMSSLFKDLVQTLKTSKKTLAVVEQCTGGTIISSIMKIAGSSKVSDGG